MTRKTRSQAKAKAKATTSKQQHDAIVTGICDPRGESIATTSDIAREVESNHQQTNRLVRFMTSYVAADRGTDCECPTCNQLVGMERSLQYQKCEKYFHLTCTNTEKKYW